MSDDVARGEEDYTITDLFEDPKFDINRLVCTANYKDKPIDNLYIIPADITLAVESRSAERFIHRHQILKDGLSKLEMKFDFILIDCRPAIDLSIESALLITDLVIVPVDMDRRATKGISDLFEVINEVKRSEAFDYLVVKTKIDKRNKVMLRSTNERISKLGLKTADSVIRTSESYKKATDNKSPVTLYEPNSRAHEDYKRLTNEVLDHIDAKGNRFTFELETA